MGTMYTENPDNYCKIEPYVISKSQDINKVFIRAEKIVFYDTCSFQRHSNLPSKIKEILIDHYKKHGMVIFITRCILMELAGDRHFLTEKYIEYIKDLHKAGVEVVVFNEEYIYNILLGCFSTTERINEYLSWAVRTVKRPVSAITETLKGNKKLFNDVVEANNLKAADLYKRFFIAVRNNKEHEDDMGEELIALCVYILSHLPGVPDGKICVLTDDKGAAARIDSAFKKTNPIYRGAKVILYSTPKLVQVMYQDNNGLTEDDMAIIISNGVQGNIRVMGITPYDLEVVNMSMPCRELTKKIMEVNGLKIVF